MNDSPRLYVAGKYGDERAAELMKDIAQKGFSLTLDWQVIDARVPFKDNKPYNMEACVAMIEGVQNCDVFVLVGHEKQHGAMVEMGAALATDKPVYIVDVENVRDSIFFCHPNIKDVSYEELLKELRNYGASPVDGQGRSDL